MTVLIEAEKAFDKTQYPFMIKILSKLGIQGHFFKLTTEYLQKNNLKQPVADIMLFH
jgi:hypothetical protein